MICQNKSNNVEYLRIKTNKLFGLDPKSQFKMNNYLFFLFVNAEQCKKHAKLAQKLPKMALNAHY